MQCSEPVGTIPPGSWVLSTPVINQSCCATSMAICQHQLPPAAIRAPCKAPDAPGTLLRPVLPADCSSLPSGSQMSGLQQLTPDPKGTPFMLTLGPSTPPGAPHEGLGPRDQAGSPSVPTARSPPLQPPPGSYHILPQPCVYFIRPRIAF